MQSKKSFYLVASFVVFSMLTSIYINFYPQQQRLQTQSVLQQLIMTSSIANDFIKRHEDTEATVNITNNDFQHGVLNPVLIKLNLYSPAISNLLLGTAIQESEIGKLSKNIFQISLQTAKDANSEYLVKYPKLKNEVDNLYNSHKSLSWNLENNVNYEVALACIIYLNKSHHPLPSATNLEALGKFWKVNYNTYLGKGTAREYAYHFRDFLVQEHELNSRFVV